MEFLARIEQQISPDMDQERLAAVKAAEKIRAGANMQTAARAAHRALNVQGFKVDYVTVRNADTLAVPKRVDEPLRLIAAAWLGKTRLIDNIPV